MTDPNAGGLAFASNGPGSGAPTDTAPATDAGANTSQGGGQGGGNQADQAIAFARAQIGKPYVFGAAGPNSFDCSGLIMAAYASCTPPIRLTHFTGSMLAEGSPVTKDQLGPGDLVFPDPGHVQLYVGGGQIIEAPQPGETVHQTAMWGFWQGRRVTTPGSGAGGSGGGGGAGAPSISKAIEYMLDWHFWYRLGLFAVGGILIVVGLGKMIHAVGKMNNNVARQVKSAVKSATKTVGGASSSQHGTSSGQQPSQSPKP